MNVFAEERWLLALAGLPVVAAMFLFAARGRSTRLARLLDPRLHAKLVRPPRGGLRAALLLGAGALAIIALARPLGTETNDRLVRRGNDVVFVIDVSRSMLATDVAPSRLDRAKQIARDGLAAMRGDRVAIVAFAGSGVIKAPLTSDIPFVRLAIDELSPESVARGGSNVGDALRETATSLFGNTDDGRHRDIVLITDGDDHESFPVEAAAALRDHRARLITIGLGRLSGAIVPDQSGRALLFEGSPVLSRMDAETLERMALASEGGVFLPVGDGYIEFDKVYRGLARAAKPEHSESEVQSRRAELFQWPLALCLLLLLLERGKA